MTAVVRRGDGVVRSGRLPKEVVRRLEEIRQDGMARLPGSRRQPRSPNWLFI